MTDSPPESGNGAGVTEPEPTPPVIEPSDEAPLEPRVYLTREQLLGADDLVEEDIYVKEWGGWIQVRAFSKGVQIEIRERAMVDEEVKQDKLQMISFLEGVVQPAFELGDQEALKEKNALAFDRVLKLIFKISGMATDDEEAEAKEAEFREAPE